uniref:B box-type domain-containing protein n=1 Tax=Neogobius melanostomus TaxID=47308 RepID=A0A8C6UGR4_9GOBI
MLAGLVEQLNLEAPPTTDNCHAGPQDVPCDMCIRERKMKAVKSCLQCLVSYCEFHLQPHSDVAVLKKHQLAEPSWNLQKNICYEHNEVKKMFCRTDQTLVCVLCCMDQHEDHVTVTASSEAVERRRGLKSRKDQLLKAVKFKEKGKDWLVEEDQAIRRSAEDAVDQIAESINNVIHRLSKKRTKMEQLVTGQTKCSSKTSLDSITARTVTSPGMAQPGPHPGARPGVGTRMRASGGRASAHGARPGTARKDNVGPPSCGPTTRKGIR